MKEKQNQITVVIPCFNSENTIRVCLESIRLQDPPAAHIILVDSEQSEATEALAKEFDASYLHSENNISLKRNLGAENAESEFICFVDADCVLEEGIFAKALELFQATEVLAAGNSNYQIPQNSHWTMRAWQNHLKVMQKEVSFWLPTAVLFVRNNAFKKVEGFNESLKACEDVDFSYRLANHGKLINSKELRFIHLNNPNSLVTFFFKEYWRANDNFELAIKNKQKGKNLVHLLMPLYAFMLIAGTIAVVTRLVAGPSALQLLTLLFVFGPIILLSAYVGFKSKSLMTFFSLVPTYTAYIIARGVNFSRFPIDESSNHYDQAEHTQLKKRCTHSICIS